MFGELYRETAMRRTMQPGEEALHDLAGHELETAQLGQVSWMQQINSLSHVVNLRDRLLVRRCPRLQLEPLACVSVPSGVCMKIAHVLFVPLLVVSCSAPPLQQESVSPATVAIDAAATITADDMRERIGFLASDALRGRDTPSPGLDTAAAWIAREFQRLGLEPGGENHTYFQRYPFTVRTLSGAATWPGLRYGADFFVWAGTPADIRGDVTVVKTDVADVPAATLKDKVVVTHVGGRLDRAWRSAVNSARGAAQLAGATGLIVVLDSAVTEENVRQAAANFATSRSASPALSVAFVRPQALPAVGGPVQIGIPAQVIEHRPPNVAGILRGSDPALRDTYVVISAHMDHVGGGHSGRDG